MECSVVLRSAQVLSEHRSEQLHVLDVQQELFALDTEASVHHPKERAEVVWSISVNIDGRAKHSVSGRGSLASMAL
jgi:hypothetical protein